MVNYKMSVNLSQSSSVLFINNEKTIYLNIKSNKHTLVGVKINKK